MVQIIYHGHSCFTITDGSYSVVLDPYDGHVPGYSALKLSANEVLCSHGHTDHAYTDAVSIIGNNAARPFSLIKIETDHDDCGGALRGKNLIHEIRWDNRRIIHMGDIGCQLSDDKIDALRGADVLMIPIGGTYTIDSRQANEMANLLEPQVVIPMHYRLGSLGFPVIAPLEQFTDLRSDTIFYDGNLLNLTPDISKQTAVLKYKA